MSALDLFFSRRAPEADAQVEDTHARSRLDALGEVYAVVELDAKGHFRDANERFLAAVKYRREELMGQHHRILVDPKEAASPAYEKLWSDLRAGKGIAAEFKRIRKDGAPLWIRAAYCPIKDATGAVTGVIKLALDTTVEREALSRGQGIIEMSLDGIVLDANQRLLDMVGYTLEEVRGQHHRALVDPAHARSAEYEAHWRRLRAGEHVSGTFERVAKGGRRIFMQASYNPVFDQNGKPIKVVKYATDVTALRTSVAEIQNVVEDLASSTGSLAASSTQLNSTAITTKDQASAMKVRSDDIAAAMQSVSAATEELNSSVSEIARSSATAAEEARDGGRAAADASAAVDELTSVSARISSVVDLIKDIADQTNLLALNATIEAASAGVAGRGFKVVADEVKALSNETARATGEIATQIEDIVKIAGTTARAVAQLSGTIETIADRQTALAATAEEQEAVTAEIASHASHVATSMNEASAEVAGLTNSAENATEVAGDVGRAVGTLSEVSTRLTGLSEQLRTA